MNLRPRICVSLLWAALITTIATSPAQSQVAESASAREAQVDRTPVLPQADKVSGGALAPLDRIRVEQIVVEGNTLLSEEEIASIVAPYQAREVTIEELYALRRALSEACVRHGYVNSGVIFPDQQISGGRIVMKEVRGSLTRIDISGNGRLKRNYIARRIEQDPGEPLRLDRLQESLELLRQDPLIRQINARLVPGLRPGESELQVSIKRSHPFQIGIGADNLTSAGSGGERGTLMLADMNLTGHGDSLKVDFGVSGGRGVGSIGYSLPLNARNTSLQAEFALDHARIVEEPFDQIDIKSRTSRGALSLFHPWILHPNSSLVTSIGIERRHSASTLLGFPFSFSAGDRNGKSDTTVVNAAVEYAARGRNQVLVVRGTLRQGVDLFNPTINEKAPDGRFTAFLGQAQYARRLGPNGSELLFRWTGQFSADPLLALEKLPIGGFNTVRGYRENQFVRDDGLAASLEWRVPVHRLRVGEGFSPLNLQVAPFVDYGRSWDLRTPLTNTGAEQIYSSGLGLLWNPLRGLRADLYWGYGFRDVHNPGDNLQDKGIHFRVQYLYSF